MSFLQFLLVKWAGLRKEAGLDVATVRLLIILEKVDKRCSLSFQPIPSIYTHVTSCIYIRVTNYSKCLLLVQVYNNGSLIRFLN